LCLSACSAAPDHEAGAPASEAVAAPDGAEVASRLGCAGCHQDPSGPALAGRTSKAPFGPNLTPDVETGLGAWSDAELTRAIREGKDDEGQTLCAVMPRFADLADADARALVLYLKGLSPVRREVPETECE
jgi:cytochrome c1